MATFLSKLFKPKWQSKNKDIRLEAIDALDINLESDQEILLNLAHGIRIGIILDELLNKKS